MASISHHDKENKGVDEKEPPQPHREQKRKLDEKVERKRIPSPLKPFFQWQWLDVLDTEKTWLEAQIIDLQTNSQGQVIKIQIHYKGWKSTYDEWLMVAEEGQEGYDPTKSGDIDRIGLLHSHTKPVGRRYDFEFVPGLSLDIRDTRDVWCVGKIQSVAPIRDSTDKMLRVGYDGWAAKYDEWINSDSYRFAPLYTHTPAPLRPARTVQPTSAYTATKDEESKFRELLGLKGWEIRDQGGDGNCLFRSVSHQVYGTPDYHLLVREKCMDYIFSERPFFENYVSGDFEQYVKEMKQNGAWGDHVEIQALSEIYDRAIEVYAYSDQPLNTYQGAPTLNLPMRLSYHYRSHYNSIVDKAAFQKSILTTTPGQIEDIQIRESKKRGGKRAGVSSTDAELNLALDLSRRDFQSHAASDLDRAIHASIHTDSKMSDWDLAVIASLKLQSNRSKDSKTTDTVSQSTAQLTEMQAALAASIEEQRKKSQDEEIQKAIVASLGGSVPMSTGEDLDAAIAASLAAAHEPVISDLDRAIAASLEDSKSKKDVGG